MNMLGMKNLRSVLGKTGVSGGNSSLPQENKDDELFKAYYQIIKECSKKSSMQEQIMPFISGTKKEIKLANKGKDESAKHEIYFHKTNQSGLKFEGFETHLGGCRAIGMIDNDKLFVYNSLREELTIVSLVELCHDKNGFCKEGANLLSETLDNENNEVSMQTIQVNDSHISKNTSLIHKDQNMPNDNWIKIAKIVKDAKIATIELNNEPQIEM